MRLRRSAGIGTLVLAIGLAAGCGGPTLCEEGEACRTISDLRQGVALEEAYHLLDRHGAALASVGGERRRWTYLDELPAIVPAAWIAVEDRRFREHGGVDFRGLLRAAVVNVEEGGVVEGASTIPMQLVRAIWPGAVAEMGPWERKALEIRAAPRLVSELGHDRVLELYLNAIYLGDGRYGVGAAARHYFGVDPEDLTLAEVATLVAMTKSPEGFDPREHPERARARRELVLDILEREGVADSEAIAEARSAELDLAEEDPVSRERTYITAAVRRELRQVAPDLEGSDGLSIHTTVDPEVQDRAVTVVREHLARVERGEHGQFLGGDQRAQAAAIAMDASTGEILALVGGRDFETTELNRALQSRRQVGSLAKPLVMAAALEAGIRATRPLSTADLSVETEEGPWSPRDHVTEPYLLPHDMVVLSSNRAAVRLGREVGIQRFASLARRVGIEGPIPPFPSTYLGAFDAPLVEVTAAFAVFGNGGRTLEPHLIRRVENAEGISIWSRTEASSGGGGASGERPIGSGTADLVRDALRDVVDGGTGWRVRRHLQGPAAGKTGTTDDGADAWFVGLRPGLAAGVWIGLDRPAPITEGASGGRLAAPLWGRWMETLTPLGYGTGEWSISERLTRVSLDPLPHGDSVRYCWGGDGPARLVPSWTLREVPVCEALPLQPGRTEIGVDMPTLESPDSVRRRPGDSIVIGGGG